MLKSKGKQSDREKRSCGGLKLQLCASISVNSAITANTNLQLHWTTSKIHLNIWIKYIFINKGSKTDHCVKNQKGHMKPDLDLCCCELLYDQFNKGINYPHREKTVKSS